MDLEAYLASKKTEQPPAAQRAPSTQQAKPAAKKKNYGGSSDENEDSSDNDFAPSKKPTAAVGNKPLPKIGGGKPKPSTAFKDEDEEDWKPMAAPAGKRPYKPSMAFFDQDSDD